MIQDLQKKNEDTIRRDCSLLVTNYVDSYFDIQCKNAKSRKSRSKLKSITGTDEFELLKILPKIKDEKKEE